MTSERQPSSRSKRQSGTKTVERGWLGKLFGLAPKVYVCRDPQTRRWYLEHQPPLWLVGFAGSRRVPCMRCGARVFERENYRPSAGGFLDG